MNILNKIINYKKAEVIQQKKDFSLNFNDMFDLCKSLPPARSFVSKLEENRKLEKISLIAEVKKASPSKGVIKQDFNPVEIAQAYERSGADAVSVLTDKEFFQGDIEYLKDVKKQIQLPVLRKDFIIDPFQIYQTRLIGADIILLIAAALDEEQLGDYYKLSQELGLEVLLEVHNEKELRQVLGLKARIIGINNRNLETFEVSINTTLELMKDIDFSETFVISESGISNNSDIVKLKRNGVSGILVGESLMRQTNIEKAVQDLLGDM